MKYFLRMFSRKLDDVTIVMGSNKLNSGGELYAPTKFVIHPKYNLSGIIHDIGLIMVNGMIKFNDHTKTIDLPMFAGDEERKYKYAVVSGWGRISVSRLFQYFRIKYGIILCKYKTILHFSLLTNACMSVTG